MISLGGRGWLQRKVTSRRYRSANQLGFDGARAGNCIRRTRVSGDTLSCTVTNRRSVPPWKRRLPSSTLASGGHVKCADTAGCRNHGKRRSASKNRRYRFRSARCTSSIRVKSAHTNGIDYWRGAIGADKRITNSVVSRRFRVFAERLQYRRLELVCRRWFGLRRPEQFTAAGIRRIIHRQWRLLLVR